MQLYGCIVRMCWYQRDRSWSHHKRNNLGISLGGEHHDPLLYHLVKTRFILYLWENCLSETL